MHDATSHAIGVAATYDLSRNNKEGRMLCAGDWLQYINDRLSSLVTAQVDGYKVQSYRDWSSQRGHINVCADTHLHCIAYLTHLPFDLLATVQNALAVSCVVKTSERCCASVVTKTATLPCRSLELHLVNRL